MVSMYILTVDIEPKNVVDENTFRQLVSPSLEHLHLLKGSFDRSPCTVKFYPPSDEYDRLFWSVRVVVSISVGKKRAEYLQQLYGSIVKLITLELPEMFVDANLSVWKPS